MAIFFMKKIWQNEADESVHSQFVRFSKGKFDNKFVTNISRNGKCKLTSTFEISSNLALFASSLGGEVEVTGVILSRENLSSLLSSLGITATTKKKAAVFQSDVTGKMSYEQIKKIDENAYCLLFDCSANGIELKLKKKKLPAPSKSGSEKVNDKFCVLELDMKYWSKLKEEFAFDLGEFKKARISHSVEVKDIILPKGETDFNKIRLNAKKKGIITRKITLDGKEQSIQKDFVA